MRMPALFVGHGSPMNAITETRFTQAWRSLGATLPRPSSILMVSGHWYIEGSAVTAMARPRTIHDFSGFPRALYEMRYPAPGNPALAAKVAQLLAPTPVRLDFAWGLDHGAWSVLAHAYPEADIPVVQLSVDSALTPEAHFGLGARLAPLRDEGVLVAASGNIVHNLESMRPDAREPFDWAARFDAFIAGALEAHDDAALLRYAGHADATKAAPDPDHFLPLLYVAGVRQKGEAVKTIVDGFDLGTVSMRSVQVSG